MALRALPNRWNSLHRCRKRERVNLRRAAYHADHERKWTVAHVSETERRPFVPSIAIENVTGDRRHFPYWIDLLLDPVQLAAFFQPRKIVLKVRIGHG